MFYKQRQAKLIETILSFKSFYLTYEAYRNNNEMPSKDEIDTYDEMAPFITKINKQQKTIQKQLADARRQQEEFQIITKQMQEGLLVIDSQTDLLSSNASALELLDAGQVKNKESVLHGAFCRSYSSNGQKVYSNTFNRLTSTSLKP